MQVPRKKRRMNKVSFHAVASVDMAIAKFFKPCWLMKKKPINHMHSEEEVGITLFKNLPTSPPGQQAVSGSFNFGEISRHIQPQLAEM